MKRFLCTLIWGIIFVGNAYAGWHGFEWDASFDYVYETLNDQNDQKVVPISKISNLKKNKDTIEVTYKEEYGYFDALLRFTDDGKLQSVIETSVNHKDCKRARHYLTQKYPFYKGDIKAKKGGFLVWVFKYTTMTFEFNARTVSSCQVTYSNPLHQGN